MDWADFSFVRIPLGISIVYLIYINLKTKKDLIEIWFLISFLIYFVIIEKPLTHIYAAYIPGIIIASIGIVNLFNILSNRYIKKILLFFVIIASIGNISYSYQAFIDTNPEYPWNQKNYIYGKMNSSISGGEIIQGVFGFPYNRNWDDIYNTFKLINKEKGISTYTSNEKFNLLKYYIREYHYYDYTKDSIKSDSIFIYIKNPQSLKNDPIPAGNIYKETNDYAIIIIENTD